MGHKKIFNLRRGTGRGAKEKKLPGVGRLEFSPRPTALMPIKKENILSPKLKKIDNNKQSKIFTIFSIIRIYFFKSKSFRCELCNKNFKSHGGVKSHESTISLHKIKLKTLKESKDTGNQSIFNIIFNILYI